MRDSCLECLFLDNSQSFLIKHLNEYGKCSHINSPFYNEVVNDNNICRLYENEKDYFRKKDLIEKINKIKK